MKTDTSPSHSDHADVSASLQTFLAFDYGLKRTGVAVGNRLTRGAQPQSTIAAEGDARFAKVGKLIQEWQPDALVIGVSKITLRSASTVSQLFSDSSDSSWPSPQAE